MVESLAQPLEVLGIEDTIANRAHQTTADLMDSCQVKFTPKKEFVQYLSKHRQTALKTILQLKDNCDSARDRVRLIGSSISGEHKLVQLLEHWAEQATTSRTFENAFAVPFTHAEIAQMIGSTRETVTRVLISEVR